MKNYTSVYHASIPNYNFVLLFRSFVFLCHHEKESKNLKKRKSWSVIRLSKSCFLRWTMQHEELLLLYIVLALCALHLNYDYKSTSTGIIHVLQACDTCLNTIYKADWEHAICSHTHPDLYSYSHMWSVIYLRAYFQTKDSSFLALLLIVEGFFPSLIQKMNSPLLYWQKQLHTYLPEVASTINLHHLRSFNLYKNKQPLFGDEEATCWQACEVIFAWCKNIWENIMLFEQMGEMATTLQSFSMRNRRHTRKPDIVAICW